MLAGAEVIVWPAAAAAVVAFLAAQLPATMGHTGVRVSTKVGTLPHVQVLRTGGPRGLVRDNAQITIDCRADDSVTAAALANDCAALLLAAGRAGVMGPHTVYEVDAFAGPQNNPDPTTSAARYSATYTVPFRGTTERGS